MTSGLRLRPAEQVLVSRARDFLAAGPSDAVDLIAHVCQLPGPPRFVADHMAMALLAPWEEFARESDGRWKLAASGERCLYAAPSAPAPGALAPVAPVPPKLGRPRRTSTGSTRRTTESSGRVEAGAGAADRHGG